MANLFRPSSLTTTQEHRHYSEGAQCRRLRQWGIDVERGGIVLSHSGPIDLHVRIGERIGWRAAPSADGEVEDQIYVVRRFGSGMIVAMKANIVEVELDVVALPTERRAARETRSSLTRRMAIKR